MHRDGLGAWMAKRRLKTPDKTAIIYGDGQSMTYRELADGADRVSAMLWQRDIRKGDRVAYIGENSPEFIEVLFGVVQLGAVFVPINTRLAPPEITHVLTDSGARVLIHDPEFTERVQPGVTAARIDHIIVTGKEDESAPGLARFIRTARAGHSDAEVILSDPAAIIYTSGTTGRAKGAVLSHENLRWVALNCLVDYDIVSTDVALTARFWGHFGPMQRSSDPRNHVDVPAKSTVGICPAVRAGINTADRLQRAAHLACRHRSPHGRLPGCDDIPRGR
jgi:fatty-acyl-CoA synthase